MQLGSILINGAEKITKTLLRDFEIVLDSGDRMGTAKMLVLYDPTSDSDIRPGATVSIYATDTESESGLWGAEIFGDPLFGAGPANVLVFSGTITSIEREIMSASKHVNLARVECRDWNSILENGIVPIGTAGYTSKTDQYIIQQLFGAVAPSVDLSFVNSTATISTFDQVEGQSLRSILQRLADLTGAIYYIDASKKLHWFTPASNPASWSLSESPDNVSSFGFDRNTFRCMQEWRTPANKVTVMGAVSTGGARITATRSDATSISTYGTYQRTISDRTITSTGAAQARGDVELANYANPQRSGRFTTRKSGLNVGQLLTIDCTNSLQFSGNFVIRRITMRWWTRSTTNYDVEWGAYLPDLARAMRAIYDAANQGQPTGVQPTTPAPDSVGTDAYVAGSIDNAALGSASVGTANIQTASITEALIQDLAVSTAKIQDLAVSNAKVGNLSATKITTDDLTVGGPGHIGQLVVQDNSGGSYGYIGGSADGGWLKALSVGGTGVSTSKLKVSNSGDLTLNMTGSGDNFTLSVSGLTVTIDNSGVYVSDGTHNATISGSGVIVASSGHTAYHTQDAFLVSDGSNSVSIALAGSNPGITVNGLVVVKDRQTGWSAMTGTATKGGGDTSTITLSQLAERVKAIIDLLMSHHQLLG